MIREKKIVLVKYITESGDCPIQDFLSALAKENRLSELSKINHYIHLLETFGYQLPMNSRDTVKKLEDTDGIYELRPIPNRIFYFHCDIDGNYVLLHGFTKKTKKTPQAEIEKAKKEAADYERRKKNG